jgi:hypothetical protein
VVLLQVSVNAWNEPGVAPSNAPAPNTRSAEPLLVTWMVCSALAPTSTLPKAIELGE